MFEARFGGNSFGDMAIDDFSMVKGKCSNQGKKKSSSLQNYHIFQYPLYCKTIYNHCPKINIYITKIFIKFTCNCNLIKLK